jgi:hypothetical protein
MRDDKTKPTHTCPIGGYCEYCEAVAPPQAAPTERLAELLKDANVEVRIGLEQQGHIPTIERMLAEGKSWFEIGHTIGWHGPTAKQWYGFHKERGVAPQAEAPTNSDPNVQAAIEASQKFIAEHPEVPIVQAEAPTPTQPKQTLCSHGVLPEWCDSCAHTFHGCLISDMMAWMDALGEKTETIYGGSKLHARHDPRCDVYLQQSCNCGLVGAAEAPKPDLANDPNVLQSVEESRLAYEEGRVLSLDQAFPRVVAESRPSAEEVQQLASEWLSGEITNNSTDQFREMALLYQMDMEDLLRDFYQWMQERITRP